jgi:hypothetical protein
MIAGSELSLSLAQRDPTGLPDEVRRAAVSGTTLSNETLPAWRNVRGRLSPVSFPLPSIPCQTNRMKRLTATICLTIAVLLGSTGMSWSADFQKGLTAAQSGDFATTLREWTPQALYFLWKNELVEMVAKDKPTSSRNGASQWRDDRNIFGKN